MENTLNNKDLYSDFKKKRMDPDDFFVYIITNQTNTTRRGYHLNPNLNENFLKI